MSAHPRNPPTPFPSFRFRRKATSAPVVSLDPVPDSTFFVADPEVLASRAAEGRVDRQGEPLATHLERVATKVPAQARAVALLHEALQHGTTSVDELAFAGLTATEVAALRLLTRAPDESYELHILTIAHASGDEGRLARLVALADIDDHLAHASEGQPPSGTPPYLWARRHLDIGLERTAAAAVAQHP